jgi:hypothetical protein
MASRRQTLPATGAAALDHQPAADGGHAGAETMAMLAHKVARLKCTLHGGLS